MIGNLMCLYHILSYITYNMLICLCVNQVCILTLNSISNYHIKIQYTSHSCKRVISFVSRLIAVAWYIFDCKFVVTFTNKWTINLGKVDGFGANTHPSVQKEKGGEWDEREKKTHNFKCFQVAIVEISRIHMC